LNGHCKPTQGGGAPCVIPIPLRSIGITRGGSQVKSASRFNRRNFTLPFYWWPETTLSQKLSS